MGGNERPMVKSYLKLFIEKVIIQLPRVEIVGKTEAVLSIFESKTAVRTSDILTADLGWLPSPPEAETADPMVNPPPADSADWFTLI